LLSLSIFIDGMAGTGDPGEGNGTWDGERHADVSGDGVVNTVLGPRADAVDFVGEQVERATIGYAQAGIRVEMTGGINFDDPPRFPAGHANAGQLVFLDDGDFDAGSGNDEEVVMESTMGDVPDVAEIFFVPPGTGFTGIASTPALRGGVVLPAGKAENTYLFVTTERVPGSVSDPVEITLRTLAHELGHGLSRQGDTANPDYVFFPALTTNEDDGVETYRRFTHAIESILRTLKGVGDLTAGGSRLIGPGN